MALVSFIPLHRHRDRLSPQETVRTAHKITDRQRPLPDIQAPIIRLRQLQRRLIPIDPTPRRRSGHIRHQPQSHHLPNAYIPRAQPHRRIEAGRILHYAVIVRGEWGAVQQLETGERIAGDRFEEESELWRYDTCRFVRTAGVVSRVVLASAERREVRAMLRWCGGGQGAQGQESREGGKGRKRDEHHCSVGFGKASLTCIF